MIDERIKLTVMHDDNAVFVDLSEDSVDYLRDTVPLEMVSAEDKLYIGFDKPINSIYVHMNTVNTNGGELTLEVWDGTAWVSLDSRDETKTFSRSGFITWDRAQLNAVEVNSTTKYYVRASVSADTTAMVYDGINLVFSDDASLAAEFSLVNDPRVLGTATSHISHHVSARNMIIQLLRNEGYIKTSYADSNIAGDVGTGVENITQWDLLDIYEIREAATFKALANIFFLLSDEQGDNWSQKSAVYNKRFESSFATAKLSIDRDDNGLADSAEDSAPRQSFRWNR